MTWAFDTSAIETLASEMGIERAIHMSARPPARRSHGHHHFLGVHSEVARANHEVVIRSAARRYMFAHPDYPEVLDEVMAISRVIVHELQHCAQGERFVDNVAFSVAYWKQARDRGGKENTDYEIEAEAAALTYHGPPLILPGRPKPKRFTVPVAALRQ